MSDRKNQHDEWWHLVVGPLISAKWNALKVKRLHRELTAVTAERDALRADKQITLRDFMAIQAYQAVATEEAGTISQAAKELGIETSKYDCDKHWNKLVALRCYKVADAFLEARAIDAAKGGRT